MTTPHPAELTEAERARLRELADAATPGPWVHHGAPNGYPAGVTGLDMAVADTFDKPDLSDAKFIAAARTAVPALLDALEAAERERDEAHEAGYWVGFAEGKDEAETRDLSFDELTDRAECAEAENQRLREGIEALHSPWVEDERWCGCCAPPYYEIDDCPTRALLSTSSVRGEGDG